MADLKKGLKKRKKRKTYHDVIASGPEDYGYTAPDTSELDSEYEAYKMESDALGSEERKESRAARKRARMVKALGQAADAIGKIGASKSGALVSGDLVPDLEVGQGELDSIADKYDTKRLSLSKKGRELKDRAGVMAEEDKSAKAAAVAARKAEIAELRNKQEVEAEEQKLAKLEKAGQKEAFKYKSKARKDVTKMTDKLIEGIEEEDMQGDDVVEVLENEGISPEIIAPFRETLGFMEDEEAQVETLEELKSKLIMHTVKKRVQQDIEDGKPVNPRIIEALGLTDEAKPDTIKEPETPAKSQTSTDGEPTEVSRYLYEITLPNGIKKKRHMTTEEAEDARDKAEKIGATIKRTK